MTKTTRFEAALATFIAGCTKISNDHREKWYPSCPEVVFSQTAGKRYVKVIRGDVSGGQRSVHCFVEVVTGNVLKAAGWKAPAKHARGNIFDEHNGLNRMNEYGPEYLR